MGLLIFLRSIKIRSLLLVGHPAKLRLTFLLNDKVLMKLCLCNNANSNSTSCSMCSGADRVWLNSA